MKYCLSGRHPLSVLKQVDEIRLNFNDFERIYEFIEELPDKTIILSVPFNTYIPEDRIKEIKNCSEKINIIVAIENYNYLAKQLKENNIKYFLDFAITTFFELNALAADGVAYVRVGAPLFFDLDEVKKRGIPIRVIPNHAEESIYNVPFANKIHSPWIRPEDVKYYEDYVDTFEFYTSGGFNLEISLFNSYKNIGIWPDDLYKIIYNLDLSVNNKYLPVDFGQHRLNCKQRCERDKNCHYCENQVFLAKSAERGEKNE